MAKAARIILGLVIVGLVLHSADLATRDCRIAPYVYDDCMWLGLRSHLGLPASRLLRMVVMECVGIALAAVLYLAFRYIFPFRRAASATSNFSSPPATDPARNHES